MANDEGDEGDESDEGVVSSLKSVRESVGVVSEAR